MAILSHIDAYVASSHSFVGGITTLWVKYCVETSESLMEPRAKSQETHGLLPMLYWFRPKERDNKAKPSITYTEVKLCRYSTCLTI